MRATLPFALEDSAMIEKISLKNPTLFQRTPPDLRLNPKFDAMKKYVQVHQRSFYTPHDEIELIDLIIWVIQTVRKYAGTIVILFTCSILGAVAFSLLKDKEYESSLTFSAPALSETEAEEIFEWTNRNIRSGNITTLEAEYGLTEGTVKQLKQVTLIKTEQPGSFRIVTTGFSNDYVAPLTKELSQLLTRRNAAASQEMKAEIDSKIKVLTGEIRNIDSMLAQTASESGSMSASDGNVGTLLKLKLDLIKESLELEIKKEELIREVVVHSTQTYAQPLESSITKYLLIAGVIALFISCVVIAYGELQAEMLKRRQFKRDGHAIEGTHKFHYN